MSPDSSPAAGETSRRRLLAMLGLGGAAGVAALISGDEARAGHDGSNVFHLGQLFNQSPGPTGLANNGSGSTLVLVKDDGAGQALFMQGKGNIESCATGPAFNVVNCVPEGIGINVFAGFEDPDPDSTAQALGFALVVNGRAVFSTVGAAVIPAGSESTFVPNTAVGDKSHVTVTLASDPGPRQLGWIERNPGYGFTVQMTPAPKKRRLETQITYMIAEPLEVVPPEDF